MVFVHTSNEEFVEQYVDELSVYVYVYVFCSIEGHSAATAAPEPENKYKIVTIFFKKI